MKPRIHETPDRQTLIEGTALLFDDDRAEKVLSKGRLAKRFQILCEPELIGVRMKKAVPEMTRIPPIKYSKIKGEADLIHLP